MPRFLLDIGAATGQTFAHADVLHSVISPSPGFRDLVPLLPVLQMETLIQVTNQCGAEPAAEGRRFWRPGLVSWDRTVSTSI